MNKKKVFLILLGLMAAAVLATGPALGADQGVLTSIQGKYQDLTSLKASYTRTTVTPAMESVFQSSSTNTASGTLLFKAPAKLSLDQASPRPEKMVTNGTTVWWFISEDNLVHLYPDVDVYGELKPLLDFLGGLGGLEGRYEVKVVPAGTGGEKNHRLDLKRLQESSGPSEITAWFTANDFSLAGFKLISLTGETTTFQLGNLVVNPALEDSRFTFIIPDGAQVIEE
ncbi:MAG: outer-membrane lipoprotein carrier protein LolA [Pseudomonadota bacterium]